MSPQVCHQLYSSYSRRTSHLSAVLSRAVRICCCDNFSCRVSAAPALIMWNQRSHFREAATLKRDLHSSRSPRAEQQQQYQHTRHSGYQAGCGLITREQQYNYTKCRTQNAVSGREKLSAHSWNAVSYTHLTLPTICSV